MEEFALLWDRHKTNQLRTALIIRLEVWFTKLTIRTTHSAPTLTCAVIKKKNRTTFFLYSSPKHWVSIHLFLCKSVIPWKGDELGYWKTMVDPTLQVLKLGEVTLLKCRSNTTLMIYLQEWFRIYYSMCKNVLLHVFLEARTFTVIWIQFTEKSIWHLKNKNKPITAAL